MKEQSEKTPAAYDLPEISYQDLGRRSLYEQLEFYYLIRLFYILLSKLNMKWSRYFDRFKVPQSPYALTLSGKDYFKPLLKESILFNPAMLELRQGSPLITTVLGQLENSSLTKPIGQESPVVKRRITSFLSAINPILAHPIGADVPTPIKILRLLHEFDREPTLRKYELQKHFPLYIRSSLNSNEYFFLDNGSPRSIKVKPAENPHAVFKETIALKDHQSLSRLIGKFSLFGNQIANQQALPTELDSTQKDSLRIVYLLILLKIDFDIKDLDPLKLDLPYPEQGNIKAYLNFENIPGDLVHELMQLKLEINFFKDGALRSDKCPHANKIADMALSIFPEGNLIRKAICEIRSSTQQEEKFPSKKPKLI